MQKYKNKLCYVKDGEIISCKEEGAVFFHSLDEAEFYIYLESIKADFTRQNKYELIPKFSFMGRLQRGITYIDDFRIGNLIIDIKGMETKEYKIKAQMMKQMCAKLSRVDGELLEYVALYDLKNHSKALYQAIINLGDNIRYMDLQLFNDINKHLKGIKGKEREKKAMKIWKATKKDYFGKVKIVKEYKIIYYI